MQAIEQLKAGDIDAICSVDLFNEGVDVPVVDRVVMLRPTESGVVFLQQLGRGLRKAPGKAFLQVIDFVGNHRMFLERVRTLLSLTSRPARVRRSTRDGGGGPAARVLRAGGDRGGGDAGALPSAGGRECAGGGLPGADGGTGGASDGGGDASARFPSPALVLVSGRRERPASRGARGPGGGARVVSGARDGAADEVLQDGRSGGAARPRRAPVRDGRGRAGAVVARLPVAQPGAPGGLGGGEGHPRPPAARPARVALLLAQEPAPLLGEELLPAGGGAV